MVPAGIEQVLASHSCTPADVHPYLCSKALFMLTGFLGNFVQQHLGMLA